MTNGAATVLFLNHATVFGGAERVTLVAMEQARARGYRPLLACPPDGRGPDAFRAAGFEVIPCGFTWMQHTRNPVEVVRYALNIARVARQVESICREEHVRLLHAVSPVAGLYAVRAARRLHIPYVLHMHDAQPPKSLRRMAILRQAPSIARFVCVSECVRQMVLSLGIPESKITVLYNAVDEAFLSEATAPSAAITGRGPHIGMFGQVVPWKGQAVFLDAARQIAPRHPNAHFHVIGDVAHSADQDYMDSLAMLANAGALKGKVTLWGYRPDAREMMAAMDVVVHASVEPEAFGLVVAEAMALGKQVVATRTGGPAEIVKDGVTGRLVEPGNATALADALEEMLLQPSAEIGARAAAAIRERFSPTCFGRGLMRIYDEVR